MCPLPSYRVHHSCSFLLGNDIEHHPGFIVTLHVAGELVIARLRECEIFGDGSAGLQVRIFHFDQDLVSSVSPALMIIQSWASAPCC